MLRKKKLNFYAKFYQLLYKYTGFMQNFEDENVKNKKSPQKFFILTDFSLNYHIRPIL